MCQLIWVAIMSDVVDQSEAGDDPLEHYMMSLFSVPSSTSSKLDITIPQEEKQELERNQNTVLRKSPRLNTVTGEMHTVASDQHPDKGSLITDDGLKASSGTTSILPTVVDDCKASASISTPKKSDYKAEQIPTDVLLAPNQKRELQALLDQSLNASLTSCADESYRQPIASPQRSVVATTIAAQDKPRIQASTLHDSGIRLSDIPLPSTHLMPAIKTECTDEMRVNHQVLTNSDVSALEAVCKTISPDLPDYRAHWSNHCPSWAQGTFDALLFKCRGVTLAIPLTSLGHIYTHEERLKQLPNTPSWMLGVKPLPQGQLKVIDAGAYFMPERAPSLNLEGELYILGLAGCLWGFAVDTLTNPVTITPEDVQWRSLNSHNPWLAGAIKKQMCVLIDAPALLTFLQLPSV